MSWGRSAELFRHAKVPGRANVFLKNRGAENGQGELAPRLTRRVRWGPPSRRGGGAHGAGASDPWGLTGCYPARHPGGFTGRHPARGPGGLRGGHIARGPGGLQIPGEVTGHHPARHPGGRWSPAGPGVTGHYPARYPGGTSRRLGGFRAPGGSQRVTRRELTPDTKADCVATETLDLIHLQYAVLACVPSNLRVSDYYSPLSNLPITLRCTKNLGLDEFTSTKSHIRARQNLRI